MRLAALCVTVASLAGVAASPAAAAPPTCYPPSRDQIVSVGSSLAVTVSCSDDLGGTPGIALVADPARPGDGDDRGGDRTRATAS